MGRPSPWCPKMLEAFYESVKSSQMKRIVMISSLAGSLAAYMLLNAVYALAEPVIIKDCESCPELVVIPAGGSFVMGAEKAEGHAWGMPELMSSQERPVATITIAHSYAIGRTEVTRAQFAEFVEETGFKTMEGCSHLTSRGWSMQPGLSWRDNSIGGSKDHPVPCLRSVGG